MSALLDVLQQGAAAINALGDLDYAEPLPALGASSAGAHYRHVLDHVVALLRGLAVGRIDYDNRDRSASLETCRQTAFAATLALIAELEARRDLPDDLSLQIVYAASGSAMARGSYSSTLGRELAFLHSHAVHHLATIAMLSRMRQLPLDPDLGMMPSTLAWRRAVRGVR